MVVVGHRMGGIGGAAARAVVWALALASASGCEGDAPDAPPVSLARAALAPAFVLRQKLVGEQSALAGAELGTSVALGADSAILGAFRVPVADAVNGAAYAWARGADGVWSEQARLLPSDPPLQNGLGSAAALVGNVALVVARYGRQMDTITGAVHEFDRVGFAEWEERPPLVPENAPNRAFGSALAFDGTTVLVADANADDRAANSGSVYAFRREAESWVAEGMLAPDEFDRIGFGHAVAVDRDLALVGQMELDAQLVNALPGRVYAFERTGGAWTLIEQFEASDAEVGDRFGSALAISGDRAVIGASGRDDDDTCDTTYLPIVEGVPDCDSGAVYVLERVDGHWQERERLNANHDEPRDEFGHALWLRDDVLVVAAPGASNGQRSVGAVYTYERSEGLWLETQRLEPDGDQPGEDFGMSLSGLGDELLVGAPHDSDRGLFAGAAYLYARAAPANDPAIMDASPPQRLDAGTATVRDGATAPTPARPSAGGRPAVMGPDLAGEPADASDAGTSQAGSGGCDCAALGVEPTGAAPLGACLALGALLVQRLGWRLRLGCAGSAHPSHDRRSPRTRA